MKCKLLRLQSVVAVALCVLMAISLVSCGDDDDEPDSGSIVGTWLLTLPESNGEYWYCQYEFRPDGTFWCKDWNSSSPEPSYNSIGTWSVANDRITLRFTDAGYEPYDETYRFSLDGNNLILYDYENPGPNVFVRR